MDEKRSIQNDPYDDGYADQTLTTEENDTITEDGSQRLRRLKMRIRRLPASFLSLVRDYKRNARSHIREGVAGFALGTCGYLLGSADLLFGTAPLGLALLCASPKKILWIFTGLCLSAFGSTESGFISVFAYATAITVRILARLLIDPPAEADDPYAPSGSQLIIKSRARAVFTESIYLRMATGAASAFIVGIFRIISDSFEYYHLFGAIFSMLTVPAAVFVYSGCFEENGIDPRFRRIAIGTLLVSLSFALRDMYIIGVSAGAFFVYFITLYVCRQSGIWRGALIGLLCGLAYSPSHAPLFALSGITVSVMWNFSAFGAMVAGGTAAMLWGFYVDGMSAMSGLLPSVMLASVCYMGAGRISLFPAARDVIFSGRYCAHLNDADMAAKGRELAYQRLDKLSDALSSLSEIFYNLSDRLSRPGLPELRRLCDRVYDRYCPSCPSRKLCWELEYSQSLELLTSLGKTLSTSGEAMDTDFPEYMRSRCLALPGIIGEINRETALLFNRAGSEDKTSVFAMDYSTVSKLISEISADSQKELTPDKELAARLTELLSPYGFGEGGVSVYGQRRKQIVARGFDVSKGNISADELKSNVEKLCGFPVSRPVIEFKDQIMTLRLATARRFSVSHTMLTGSAGEEVCGDSVSCFENENDRFYALISDGMGTGESAALTSSLCSIFLQRMLSAGNGTVASIRMLNAFISSRREECSATVDLLELDLLSGRASFLKCGAATTFIKRGRELTRLSAATLPLGILDRIDAGRLSFDAREGDVIIMISDGICQGDRGESLLTAMLNDEWDDDCVSMAKKITAAARREGSRDDASVILIKVCGEKTA